MAAIGGANSMNTLQGIAVRRPEFRLSCHDQCRPGKLAMGQADWRHPPFRSAIVVAFIHAKQQLFQHFELIAHFAAFSKLRLRAAVSIFPPA